MTDIMSSWITPTRIETVTLLSLSPCTWHIQLFCLDGFTALICFKLSSLHLHWPSASTSVGIQTLISARAPYFRFPLLQGIFHSPSKSFFFLNLVFKCFWQTKPIFFIIFLLNWQNIHWRYTSLLHMLVNRKIHWHKKTVLQYTCKHMLSK